MQSRRTSLWWRCVVLAAALLPAAVSRAGSGEPQGGPKSPSPKYTDVKFVSGGQTIKVWQYVPAEGQGPFPGIILLHGIDGLDLLQTDIQVQLLYRTVASRLAQKGYVVHFIHYFQRTPLSKDEIPTVKAGFLQQAQDKKDHKDTALDPKLEQHYKDWIAAVCDGLEFLRQHKDVDKDCIGIVGLSMGGFVASSVVVEHPELKVGALVNVFGGLPAPQHDKVRKNKMKLPPMLIMGAEEDDIVPELFQRELFQLWRDTGNAGEAHFYGGVGHAFYDKASGTFDQNMALNEALPTTQRFLKRHLQTKK